MTTQSQTEANRTNAEKSTGPRTEAGKSRTRRNATRHGLCSQMPITGDEEYEEFKILLADLRLEHHPDGPSEDIFVFKMAEHFWFGKRASVLLAKHLTINEDSPLDDDGNFKDNVKQVSLMLRYHTTADRGFIKNFNELRKLQKERRLEEIGFVPQNAETQPETPPEAPQEAPQEATPPTEMLPPIVVNMPNAPQVVVSYLPVDVEKNRPSVQKWLAGKGLFPKQAA